MDQRLEQIQKEMQEQLQEQLAKIQQEIKDQMLEAQRNMMAEMAQLLKGATDKGKGPMTITEGDNEDHPPGFTPPHVQTQAEAYPRRPSITIRPQQGQVNAGIPLNFQSSLGFNPGDNPANPVIPGLDVAEREEMRLESSRQLEEHYRWLGKKFKAFENADNHQGIDAKDLSLVPDLVLFHKFKMQEFEKYNGTTCPETYIIMFCRRMTGYVNNDQLLIHCFQDNLVRAANMEKKPNKSFKQYAQRWREVAMQVQLSLLEKETTMLFINTLKALFITHMIGSTTKSFADMVMAGEMIENAIRGGKIEGETAKRSAPRRKDNEGSGSRQNSKKISFTPIPLTYRELYQSLFNVHAIAPFHLKLLQPPYPKWYDANAKYEYHARILGHSIENCTDFKKAVERLIKLGVVKFDNTPNTENPLPNHGDQGVNAIGKASERRMKEDIAEVRIPMKVIWEEMMKRGMLTSKNKRRETRNYGEFHENEGHEVQDCKKFKALVQGFIDNKELQIFKGSSYEKQVCVLEDELKGTSRPRIIISLLGNNEVGAQMVPKSYDCSVTVPEDESIASTSNDVQVEGSHTRSGKRYDTVGIREEPTKTKNISTEKEKEAEVPIKEPVKEEEAKEFLKFLKHSGYSMVEQLRRQSARISVLALLLSSEVHRDALMKVLNETYVTHDISVSKLDRLVNNIIADNFIYFNDDKIPPGGRGLPNDGSHMKTCQNVVRAFDGTERKLMGKIDIPLEIGPRRPWIHSAGAVPSSLHQKLKLVRMDEFVNATFISEGSELPVPKIARATRMALQMMVGKGALPGRGLREYLQRGTQISELKKKRDRFGLGFKPDYKQRRKEVEKRQERKRARLNGREVEWEPITFPPISQTFIFGGLLIEESHQINAIHDEGSEQGNFKGIRPYEPGSSLNN
ncbi:uncharacterized protein LOC128280419 [Gossypium arboreum]|uniref:uncharacterized protein LOC128280419 n=1 Tax=Gossypium arboreum TaxID=29729 RepID=UPI0022F17E78|nr:uncharacterized protein LOC128280419 [Gossypium arboreum]